MNKVLKYIIIVGIFVVKSYLEKREVKEWNSANYELIECVIWCESYFNETVNMTLIDKDCSRNCDKTGDVDFPERSDAELITSDEDIIACIMTASETGNYKVYQDCLRELLPILKERYNIKS